MSRRTVRQAHHDNDVHLLLEWVKDLPQLLATVGEVIDLDVAHPSMPDGYSSFAAGAGGDGGGRRTVHVDEDEHGPAEDIEVTSVEAMAINGRIHPDVIRSLAKSMTLHRRELADALSQLRRDSERFHNLRNPMDVIGPYCQVAKDAGLPDDPAWEIHRRTTFAGYLRPPWPEERPVSRFVYDFTRQHRRLPFEQELREYLSKGVVRVHAV